MIFLINLSQSNKLQISLAAATAENEFVNVGVVGAVDVEGGKNFEKI